MKDSFLYKNIFWVYVFMYLAAPLSYFFRMILSRELSLEEFGLFYAIISFFTVIAIIEDFGITESLRYYATKYFSLKKPEKVKGILYSVLVFKGFILFFFSTVLFFSSEFISKNYLGSDENVLMWFIVYFIAVRISVLFMTYFSAKQQTAFVAFEQFAKSSFVIILFFVLNPWFDSLYSAVIAWILTSIVILMIYVIPYLFVSKGPSKKTSLNKDFYVYAFQVALGTSAMVFINGVDIQFLTFFVGLEAVALYSNAFAIASLLVILITPLGSVLIPYITKSKTEHSLKHAALG